MRFNLTTPEDSEEISQGAIHTLYVEGREGDIDYVALEELLNRSIQIKGMGPRSRVTSVAQALHTDHPHYYFLIDRDAQSDETVQRSWVNFPDPTRNNLIIWQRKEIENYFIDPDFVTKSEFFIGERQAYIERLQQEAGKRIYFEAVNRVIIEIREQLKESWIDCLDFTEGDFQTLESARERLLACSEFSEKIETDGQILLEGNLANLFETEVSLLLGTAETCTLGTGKWLELMSGKELFRIMIHNTKFFRVTNLDEQTLQGRAKELGLVKSLVRLPEVDLPEDFQNLRTMIYRVMDGF